MSATRRKYVLRLIGRVILWLGCLVLCAVAPQSFDILEGMGFFHGLSLLHLLWGIWVVDMLLQLIPIKKVIPISLGSLKLFASRFRPSQEKPNMQLLRRHIVSTTKAAYKVFFLWVALICAIGVLYRLGLIPKMWMLLISVLFYVCDLICVLIWCPFRLIMKNKCCTTCRIFNWDHLMMFSPLVFIGGFYAISLVVLAVLAWLIWELCVMLHPERFSEMTNVSLKCSECTDKLCTQYCQKLR